VDQNTAKIKAYLNTKDVAPDIREDKAKFLEWHFLTIAANEPECSVQYFKNFITSWVSVDDSGEATWSNMKNLLAKFELDVDDIILGLCIHSFDVGKSIELGQVLENVSSKTSIPAVTFQAAFMAFNNDAPQKTIELIESIGKETSQTLTLKSQAYQDLRDFEAAHDALCSATEINPNDALAWFQLAKNDLAYGNIESAWDAITTCEELFGTDEEINHLKLMIGLEKFESNQDSSNKLFSDSLDFYAKHEIPKNLFIQLTTLCLKYGEENWYIDLCSKIDFKLYDLENGFLNFVTATLRKLHILKWPQASISLNDGIQILLKTLSSSEVGNPTEVAG
jgi:tetratricopeptide (TPR) repeat protein